MLQDAECCTRIAVCCSRIAACRSKIFAVLVVNDCQADHHRRGWSFESLKPSPRSADDPRDREACAPCDCLDLEEWGEEVDDDWINDRPEPCLGGGHD